MTGARALWLLLALAALAVTGIVGMLLAAGVWDALFFAMATAPLLVGLWCRQRVQRTAAPR